MNKEFVNKTIHEICENFLFEKSNSENHKKLLNSIKDKFEKE